MKRRLNLACVWSAAFFSTAPLSATPADADADAMATRPERLWQVQADVGFVTGSPFSGWGVGLRGLAVWRYVAVGTGVDSVRLSASGVSTHNNLPFDQSFRSTYAGALVRGRLPLGVVTPYAEIGVGYAWIGSETRNNSQCSYQSSIAAAVAAGADARIARGLELGLRWEARPPSGGTACNAAYGPWSFDFQSLHMFAAGTGYRW